MTGSEYIVYFILHRGGKGKMNMEDIRPFTEMTSRELFTILTGDRGIVPQMNLQNIIRDYIHKYGDTADIVTMVHKMAEEE